MNSVAIISGGGSWGCYTVGRLLKLNKKYSAVIGCSTGSLMAPLVALGKYERLEEAYTSVKPADIFDSNPFKSNGDINYLRILFRILSGKMTIGETNALRKTITKFFTMDDHNEIIDRDIPVIITVTNISNKNKRTEYKDMRYMCYEDCVDYMWASSSIPMAGTLVYKDNQIYCDGGTTEAVPLKYAIHNFKSSEIDCFIHSTGVYEPYKQNPKNIIHLVTRLLDIQRAEISDDNILNGYLQSENIINSYYLPEKPCRTYTVFDSKIMKQWIETGKNSISINT